MEKSGKKWFPSAERKTKDRALFEGCTQLSLDAKGRLAIPARYRDQLAANGQAGLTLTADSPSCLLIYPTHEWEQVKARLLKLPNVNPAIRTIQRRLIGFASSVEMDGAGRVLVSPELRAHAALDKQVMLVGQGNKFELWDESKWSGESQAPLDLSEVASHAPDFSW